MIDIVNIIKPSSLIKRKPPENFNDKESRYFKWDFDNKIGEIHLARINKARVVQYWLFSRMTLLKHYCLVPQFFEAFFWKSYLKNIILSKSNLDKGL